MKKIFFGLCAVVLVLGAMFGLVGCSNSSNNGEKNEDGYDECPYFDYYGNGYDYYPYCDDWGKEYLTDLQSFVDFWVSAEKKDRYNRIAWDELQIHLAVAQRILDTPISESQKDVMLDLLNDAVARLFTTSCPEDFYSYVGSHFGIDSSWIPFSMTVVASQNDRVFTREDFPEIYVGLDISNGIMSGGRRHISFNFPWSWYSPLPYTRELRLEKILYSISLLRIRDDVYSAWLYFAAAN